jgi:hypothetical protein
LLGFVEEMVLHFDEYILNSCRFHAITQAIIHSDPLLHTVRHELSLTILKLQQQQREKEQNE